MDFIISILGKIIGAFMLLGLIGWLLGFIRAIIGIAMGESFSFFLPFGFIPSKRNKRH